MTSLYIAIPVHGSSVPAHELCVRDLVRRAPVLAPDVAVHVEPLVGDSLVTRARNTLAHLFLRSGADILFFIDSDIVFAPEAVFEMVARCTPERPILCGAYPRKQIDWALVAEAARSGVTDPEALAEAGGRLVLNFPAGAERIDVVDGCFEVSEAGTGFMMIRREVLIGMAYARPDLLTYSAFESIKNQPNFWFFGEAIRDRRLLSEDYEFCQRARALGFRTYVYAPAELRHVGAYAFRGTCAAIMTEAR